jgi:hypothetical protein
VPNAGLNAKQNITIFFKYSAENLPHVQTVLNIGILILTHVPFLKIWGLELTASDQTGKGKEDLNSEYRPTPRNPPRSWLSQSSPGAFYLPFWSPHSSGRLLVTYIHLNLH